MANVIIGIHGLANKPEKALLSQWWEASIREGLKKTCGIDHADFRFIMVYWADLLYKNPQHQDPAFDFDALYINQPYIEAAPGALKKYDEGWFDITRAAAGSVFGSILDSVQGFRGIDKLGDWILQEKLRDLAYYYNPNRQLQGRDGHRAVARQVLKNDLIETLLPLGSDRLMLISHSMGTVISYDALRDLGQQDPDFAVHHFVTMGSPLGIPHVTANIEGERGYDAATPVRTPTVVRERWVNYADRRDPVAVDSHLRDDFKANIYDVRVEDDLIVNDYLTPIEKENKPHKSFGYLRTPEISEQIRDFLQ